MGEQKVVNTPSDGSLRKVSNSIGIKTNAPDDAKLKAVHIDAPEYAFAGYGVKLSAYGEDTYQRTKELSGKVTYKTDNGTVRDGILIPKKAGTAKVTVTSGGKTATAKITVLDRITELSFKEERAVLSTGESYTPVLVAKDADGRMVEILPQDLELVASSGCVEISEGKIFAVSKGARRISVKIGEVTANMQVLVDLTESLSIAENVKIPDSQNTAADIKPDGYRFAVFGDTKSNQTMFDMFVMNKACLRMKSTSEFQYILGSVNVNTLTHIEETYHTAKEYSAEIKNGDTFITLPNTSGKIYTNDTSVWSKFQADVKNAKGNLFVFIDRNYISYNEAEVTLFKKILEEAAKERCVYVFGGGFVNNYTIENKVRYVNTAGFFPSVTLTGTSIDYIEYVLVTVNGDEVTYEYRKAVR